jgi:hypothetical protein
MSREEITSANDLLRTQFKGGMILFTPAVADLPAQLRGKALHRLTQYKTFYEDSDHSRGIFIFADMTFVFQIGEFAGERSLTLSLGHEHLI